MGSNISQKLLEATVLRLSSPNLLGAAKINQHLHGDLSSWYERREEEEELTKGRERRKGRGGGERVEGGRRASSINTLFKSYQDLRTYRQLIN